MRKVKKAAARTFAAALAFSMILGNVMPSSAAAKWVQDSSGIWNLIKDDGTKATGWYKDPNGVWYYLLQDGRMLANTWFQDADGRWYYLSGSGAMLMNGWLEQPDGKWYYFGNSGAMLSNTFSLDGYTLKEDGTWDAAKPRLSAGWHQDTAKRWFYVTAEQKTVSGAWYQDNGKWYYFDGNGVMLANTVTPDGYTLNSDGSWNESIPKKTITVGPGGTSTIVSSGRPGGGSGGGSGGGGGGSSFGGGNKPSQPTKPDEKPDEPEKAETYSYRIIYRDVRTDEILKESEGEGKRGETIKIPHPEIPGYKIYDNQPTETVLDSDGKTLTVYYNKEETQNPATPSEAKTYYDYSVRYRDAKTKDILSEVTGKAEKGSTIEIEYPEIDGYTVMEDQPTDFKLTSNGKAVNVYYQRDPDVASPSEAKEVSWEVRFTDKETHSKQLAATRKGKIKDGGTLYINYMSRIIDGSDIWEAIEEPPVEISVYGPGNQIYYVEYEKTGELPDEEDPEQIQKDKLDEWIQTAKDNEAEITGEEPEKIPDFRFNVTNQKENDTRVKSLVGQIDDTEEHSFYLIGINWEPNGLVIPNTFDDVVYSNLLEDTISYKGDTYYIVRMSVVKKYAAEDGEHAHRWDLERDTAATCLRKGVQTWTCSLCGEEIETYTPALGHADENQDSICDRCDTRAFAQEVGSEIKTDITIEDSSKRTLTYVCIDDDYQGGMLYISKESIPLTDFNGYGELQYEKSNPRQYFHNGFQNAFSITGDSLLGIEREGNSEKDFAAILTETEAEKYKDIIPQTESFLVRKDDGRGVVGINADGSKSEVFDPDVAGYGIRPVILLAKPDAGIPQETHWNIGDMVAREIDGNTYIFECIDQNYSDKTENHREGALFFCTSVIPANTGSEYVYEEQLDGSMDYTFKPGPIVNFGNSNDYKYSKVQKWLAQSGDDYYDTEDISIGVDKAYMGATEELRYEDLDEDALLPYYIGHQKLTGRLFILSVDEALKYRDYLWRFEGSDTNNPDTQYGAFSKAYWLRNPMGTTAEYNETNQVYVVDLVNGNIHPNAIKPDTDSTDEELKVTGTVGVRPAFVLPQL